MMKLGLSLSVTGVGGLGIPQELVLAVGGDSLALRSVSNAGTPSNLSAFVAQAENYYGSGNVTIEGFAQGGLELPKTWATIKSNTVFFWDNTVTPGVPDSKLTGLISSGITNTDAVNAVILFLGTNDIGASLQSAFDAMTITKDEYKTAYKELAAYLYNTAFINSRFIGVVPYHRNDGSVTSTTLSQAVKEATLEAIDEVSYMKLFPCIWDVDLDDSVHPTGEEQVDPATAAYQSLIVRRLADACATYHRLESLATIGPRISTAELKTDHLLVTVSHDTGTDITVPANAELGMRMDDDGSALTIDDVSRESATTFKVDLPNQGLDVGSTYTFYNSYGQSASLSRTSAEVIVDNSTYTLPIVQDTVSVTDGDLIRQLPNLVMDMNARGGVRTLSGSDVTNITQSVGGNLTSAAGRYPQYDDTAFSNTGALFDPDGSTHMLTDTNFSSASAAFFGIVFEVPASPGADAEFMCQGNSVTGNSGTRLRYEQSGDKLRWGDNEAGFRETISEGSIAGNKHILIGNYKSDTELDFYYNNGTTVTVSLDPKNQMGNNNRVWLFSRTTSQTGITNLKIARAFHCNAAHNPLTDPSISDIFYYLNAQYSVGL